MLANRLRIKVKEVLDFNKIETKSIEVKEKEVLDSYKLEKVFVYQVKIKFNKAKVLFDNYQVLYYTFSLRFKTYRCFTNCEDNSFNFTLRERNLKAIHDILDGG